MADDIDIEEHDVLESLRRRQMPSVIVKEEPLDEEYTESEYGAESGYEPQWDWTAHSIEPTEIKVEKPDETDFQFGKIILGSKPPGTRDDQPAEDKSEDEEAEEDMQENYNYNMSLVLEDWGPILQASNCYCNECQILFATVNALDAHKMISHSFLIATDKEPSPERNKAIKSTAKPDNSGATCEICKFTFKGEKQARFNLMRHYRTVHKIDPLTIDSENELRNWKICNHCNVYFPSDTALVKHLYELLPLNDNKATKDDKSSPAKVQSVAPNDNVKVTQKVTTFERKPVKPNQVSIPTVSKKPNPVPVPTISKKPNTVPVPTVSKKPNAVPVPSVSKIPNPVLVPTASIIPKPALVPTVANVDGKLKRKPVNAKGVKPITAKQANILILGSKVNGVEVKVKKEKEGIKTTERECEVCGIEYSRKYYLKHMQKFHPNFLIIKKNRLNKIQGNTNNVRFKCRMCNLICNSPSAAKKHRNEKHPEMKGRRNLLTKIVTVNKIKKVKTKPKGVGVQSEEKNDLVVSKSTLFKCNRCSVHFLTCYGACAHSRVCESSSNIRDWSCPQCHRVLKSVDKKAHEFQHTIVGNKFKVYVVYLEMVVRILCECPYCYVCFEEYKFWRHVNFGCERDTESFHCSECRVPIDSTSKDSHERKHVQGDFTKEDFIKIDFISSLKELEVKVEPEKEMPMPNLKRKMNPPDVEPKKMKQTRNYDELHFVYCPTCKTCSSRKVRKHRLGKCRGVTSCISCKVCGISFTSKSITHHMKLHKKYPNLTLNDLVFTRITDDKRIKPIPEYYPCKNCQVIFFTKKTRRNHECGKTKSSDCQVCQRKIPKGALKMHMAFHNYALPGRVKTSTKQALKEDSKTPSPLPLKRSEVKSPTKLLTPKEPITSLKQTHLPELLMKYQSLTTVWNILYVCETCDTFTDSYDKVVEHCQNHFINMESYGVVIMKCQICNMKFDRECYRRHLELHGGSNVISRKSFKILRYAHAKLFSTEWLTFIDLPEDQKMQILTRSKYGETRCVRMQMEQQGPPEYTLYRCQQCLKCITPDTIIHHIKLRNCLKANKLICPHCPMTFANRGACDQHIKIHDATGLEAESFRIIAFNYPADAELNKKILSEHEAGEVVETVAPPESPDFLSKYVDNVKTVKGKKFYMFYKCADCDVCTLDNNSEGDHVCSTSKKVCTKCGLSFPSKLLGAHGKLHDKIVFSEKNVFTRSFFSQNVARSKNGEDESYNNVEAVDNDKQNDKKKDEAKLYKCHCGLHFISLKTIEKHYQGKNCSSVVREKCSQCNLLFDPNEVVNHLCKHHAQTQFKSFDIITPSKKTVYKCDKCHVLFYDKRIGSAHKLKCDGVCHGTKCEECGLVFDGFDTETHKNDHSGTGRLKRDCYIIVNITDDGRRSDNNVLYKCKKCNIHYIEMSSAKNHVVKYNHQTNQVKKCDECGLRFSYKVLVRHVELHHNMLKIDRFRIKCIPGSIPNTPADNSTASGLKVNKKSTVNKPVLEEEIQKTLELKTVKKDEVYKIYRCKKCKLHFTDGHTLVNHNEDRCSKELVEVCELCSLKFATKNINEHKNQHYNDEPVNMDIIEDADIVVENVQENDDKIDVVATDEQDEDLDYDTNVYKCKYCDLHFNIRDTASKHIKYSSRSQCSNKRPRLKCEECGFSFTKISLTKHKSLHDKYDLKKEHFNVVIVPEPDVINQPASLTDEQSQASTIDTVASLDSTLEAETSKTHPNIQLYKCGDCKVYFMSQITCYKHITNHTPMNLKDYIECKLCGFQFTITTIQIHIKKHHAEEFRLEEVLVQEYQPGVYKNNQIHFETYFAIDKEQSALVSTSSDVNNDLSSVIDASKDIENEFSKTGEAVGVDSSEVTSNCIDTDKVESTDKT